MFSTFTTVLTLLASTMTGQFVHAARDVKSVDGMASTMEDRSLRKKGKSTPFEHMPVEALMFNLNGPDSYDDPTDEEVDFLLDCIFESYDLAREGDPEEHALSFVALDKVESGRHDRDRSLRAGGSDYWGKLPDTALPFVFLWPSCLFLLLTFVYSRIFQNCGASGSEEVAVSVPCPTMTMMFGAVPLWKKKSSLLLRASWSRDRRGKISSAPCSRVVLMSTFPRSILVLLL